MSGRPAGACSQVMACSARLLSAVSRDSDGGSGAANFVSVAKRGPSEGRFPSARVCSACAGPASSQVQLSRQGIRERRHRLGEPPPLRARPHQCVWQAAVRMKSGTRQCCRLSDLQTMRRLCCTHRARRRNAVKQPWDVGLPIIRRRVVLVQLQLVFTQFLVDEHDSQVLQHSGSRRWGLPRCQSRLCETRYEKRSILLQLCLLDCPHALRPSNTLWDFTCMSSRPCVCLWSAEQLT